MRLVKTVIFYLLGVFGIICISAFPQFFATSGVTEPLEYFKELGSLIVTFVQPEYWLYQVPQSPGEFSLVGTLWEPYTYSMKILLSALLLGFFFAFLFALTSNFLPRAILQLIKRSLDFFESVPDIVIAAVLQIFVIYIYKTYGVTVFNVASFREDKAYLGPIITLSILPMVSLFKILLLMIEEESLKDYVGFLKSKGIKKTGILLRHIIKNILPTTFHHSKVIIWGTLSSQFVIERIFNVHGITFYIVESFTPMTIVVSLIMLFTPFFLFFQMIEWWIGKESTQSVEIRMNHRYSFDPLGWIRGLAVSLKNINWRALNPFSWLTIFFRHMKNYKFAIGSLFFILLIGYSVIYSITTDSHIDKEYIIYEEDGVGIKSVPPHPPTDPFLLGSDGAGFSMYDMLLVGAKYTLIFGLLIALLRVLFGLLGGVVYTFVLGRKFQRWFEKLVDSIHFLPLSVIAYLLLRPILVEQISGFAYSQTERIILEIIILTVLVVPLTTVLLGNEMKRVLNYEFIMSAKVLGGSRFHIFWRHILPHIGPRMTILFGQQFIQTLLIFMHLGVFHFFFGGTHMTFGMVSSPPRSLTYEWSGLIGANLSALNSGKYWLILFVLLAFTISIFAMQFIINGVKEVQQVKVGVLYKAPKLKRKKENDVTDRKPSKGSFRRISQGSK